MAEKTVATADVQRPVTTESTRNQERYVAPPVDIYETRDGLVVLADLPGVSKDALDVRVDNNILTIRGRADH
ncbi:MAG: Hsp20/alpha crystallin family protein, partial [Candidatus Tectimicrobiota bacterium]